MPDTLTDNTICNSQLVDVSYSTVLQAIELTDSDPFTMTIRCDVEWAATLQRRKKSVYMPLGPCLTLPELGSAA